MEAKVNIGIKEVYREHVALELSRLLSDEYILYTKSRNAHWNVIGHDFIEKHKFFEEQYVQIEEFIDDVAERIRLLGFSAPATLKEFLDQTHLRENLSGIQKSTIFIQDLLYDHETVIQFIRSLITPINDEYGDAGTSDFLTGMMEKHEKIAWMLRVHL